MASTYRSSRVEKAEQELLEVLSMGGADGEKVSGASLQESLTILLT